MCLSLKCHLVENQHFKNDIMVPCKSTEKQKGGFRRCMYFVVVSTKNYYKILSGRCIKVWPRPKIPLQVFLVRSPEFWSRWSSHYAIFHVTFSHYLWITYILQIQMPYRLSSVYELSAAFSHSVHTDPFFQAVYWKLSICWWNSSYSCSSFVLLL